MRTLTFRYQKSQNSFQYRPGTTIQEKRETFHLFNEGTYDGKVRINVTNTMIFSVQ